VLNSWFFAFAALWFVVLMVLAFPCFVAGLLALPLYGAAPTFLCPPGGLPSARLRKEKQRKAKESGVRRQLAGARLLGEPGVVLDEMCSRANNVSDKWNGRLLP
jgi:hypothetical protein